MLGERPYQDRVDPREEQLLTREDHEEGETRDG